MQGYGIEFSHPPFQSTPPTPHKITEVKKLALDSEVDTLLSKGVIVQCSPCSDHFLSPFFLVQKPNGKFRFILNLKKLNSFVIAPHFQMEDFRTAANLIQQDYFMTCLDLKDAYYLVPIHESSRKYLRFQYNSKFFEFTCLPFGLCCAPYVFTKLCRPIVQYIRKLGIQCVMYLDDILILGPSAPECRINLLKVIKLLESLGFIINSDKCQLYPSLQCKFLGFIFDSHKLNLELPAEKQKSISLLLTKFINIDQCSIREFAQLLGILNAACPAIKYGRVYTKELERHKLSALIQSNFDYNACMAILPSMQPNLLWWLANINSVCSLKRDKFDLTIYTDASLSGWGAHSNNSSCNGWWTTSEKSNHINFLESLAVFYGLKCFASDLHAVNILIRVDNTTALSYINRMGSVRFPKLGDLAKEIWQWCETRKIWIFASYISTKENILADIASRKLPSETELALSQKAFGIICNNFGYPKIDLFASKANHKCETYVSWGKDPGSAAIDAFTLNWHDFFFYAFPPFCLILRTLKKIVSDKAEGVVVVPNWPSQA